MGLADEIGAKFKAYQSSERGLSRYGPPHEENVVAGLASPWA